MEQEKIEQYKMKLEAEQAALTADLSTHAVQNPDNPTDWQVTGSDVSNRSADPNKLADHLEEEFAQDAVTSDLEKRLVEVQDALARIESGTYGICAVSGNPIETDRLEANPAATTCKEHMNDR